MISFFLDGVVYGTFYILLAFVFFDVSDSARVLEARAATPSPLSVAPTQNWNGNDGPWSTFAFSIGTPPQLLSLLIGTSSSQTWGVATEGCGSGDPTSCATDRGTLWNRNDSTTYSVNTANSTTDIYTLDLEDQLGYVGKGRNGFDTVQLGWQKDGVALKNQTVVGIATKDYFLGIFGLDPRNSSFQGDDKPVQSYIATLKEQSIIPSLSWGYTAGNQYRLSKVTGSLTLGGYDSSKFTPNGVTFAMTEITENNKRDLMTPIQKITTNSGSTTLLPEPIVAYLDSSVPFIYLPEAAWALFEAEFKLTWNETFNLYIISETTHVLLLAQNPSITFTLGNATHSVDIVLPYAAFDLTAGYPYTEDATTTMKYFPLRRAQNETQFTLGRTFFQEAYVIADYEQGNFSVSQCDFNARAAQNLVAIFPVGGSKAKKTPVAIIAGAAGGGALLLAAVLLYFFWWRPRQRRKNPQELDSTSLYHPLHHNSHQKDPSYIKAELDAGENNLSYQGRYGKPAELGGQSEIYEMPADGMAHEMANLEPKDEKKESRRWTRGSRVDVLRQNTTDTLGFPRTPVESPGLTGESSIQTTPAANYALPVPRRNDPGSVGVDRGWTASPGVDNRGEGPSRMDSTADSMGFPRSPGSTTISSAGNSMRVPGSLNSRVSPRESPLISPASDVGRGQYRRF